MQVTDRLQRVLTAFPAKSTDAMELARLQEFLQRMKEAGIARTRDYDLPQPDTLGRALVERKRAR